MSSPGYAALSLEPPCLGFAEVVTAAMCAISAITTEMVLDHYPGAPAGAGVAIGAMAAAWLYLGGGRGVRGLRKAVWLRDGAWRLEFRDGTTVAASLGPGTRMLGRSLVLHWCFDEGSLKRWLTPWDVDDSQLRAVAVRLASAAGLRTY